MKAAKRVLLLAVATLSCGCAPEGAPTQSTQLLVDRWVAAINTGRDAAVLDEFLTADYVWHLPGRDVHGLEAVKAEFAKTFEDSPDFQLIAEAVVADGGHVVVRWTIRGTSQTTGTRWESSSITLDRISDGKFAEGWEVVANAPWMDATAAEAPGS